jgi:H+/Cl- antiporter ClcA
MSTTSKNFNTKRLVSAVVPSYVFPTIMSFIPGYLLNKSDLMSASYTTIAIPSLIVSLLTYFLLWRMEVVQSFPSNILVRTLLMAVTMVTLGFLTILTFGFQTDTLDIIPSCFLGAVITTLTQKMSKQNKNNEYI